MESQNEIQKKLDELRYKYGEWSSDIPLPFGIWTRGDLKIPNTRLKRIMQIVSDLSEKPLSESRILDLGCLDGVFSIELAQRGAQTVGVEVREANIQKAIFCKDILKLHNLEFRKDDVRNISSESYGEFDVIICSGILYHLPAGDAINLIHKMFEMAKRAVIIDTHTSLESAEVFLHGDVEYRGCTYREHEDNATPEQKAKSLWAAADNVTSFWFTRPSLVNILSKAGFSSIYECFSPTLIQPPERCTFVAIKGVPAKLNTSPAANNFQENWPETSLRYAAETKIMTPSDVHPVPFYKKVLSALKK
jgi:SAM-dependent methyltransferase